MTHLRLSSTIRISAPGFDTGAALRDGETGSTPGTRSVDPGEMEKLSWLARMSSRLALAIDPDFVDAKSVLISCLGHLVYFHRTRRSALRKWLSQFSRS